MKFTSADLTTHRQWRATLGLDQEEFYQLLAEFKKSYLKKHYMTYTERLVDSGIEYCIKNEEDLLFFTLFSLKSGLTYDVLGVVSGMSASNAQNNQRSGIEVLGELLESTGLSPKRKFLNRKEFEKCFTEENIPLLIDATEQIIQRPSDKEKQKKSYSGKKKRIPSK
jgi:hypothetical protein